MRYVESLRTVMLHCNEVIVSLVVQLLSMAAELDHIFRSVSFRL